ncbi:MAG TPA: hypothetical protein VI356_22875 [Myxococcales bacterium]
MQPAGDTTGLAAELQKTQPHGRALAVRHSNTVPEIAAALGVREKIAISDDEYDALFVVVEEKLLRLRQP